MQGLDGLKICAILRAKSENKMIPIERQIFIYQYVQTHQLVTIETLIEQLNVSAMTIRRDIQILEKEGKIISVSGGIKIRQALIEEPSYQEKLVLNQSQKAAIGQASATLIKDSLQKSTGLTLYLDAGTTCFEIAKAMMQYLSTKIYPPLTVISNDFAIITYLTLQAPRVHSPFSLFHTGGEVDLRNASAVGNYAAEFISHFNLDLAFISTSSWDLVRGISTPSAAKISVKENLLKACGQCILVSDSSKYGEYGRFKICDLTAFDCIITDWKLPKAVQDALALLPVKLLIVDDIGDID